MLSLLVGLPKLMQEINKATVFILDAMKVSFSGCYDSLTTHNKNYKLWKSSPT